MTSMIFPTSHACNDTPEYLRVLFDKSGAGDHAVGGVDQRAGGDGAAAFIIGKDDVVAELEAISSEVIEPGKTTSVLPLDEGIHLMRGAMDAMTVSLNVYGKTVRPGYIQFFNPAQKKVTRIYPPSLFNKVCQKVHQSIHYPPGQVAADSPDQNRPHLLPVYKSDAESAGKSEHHD
jgi:hypothetical protein